MTTRDKDLVSKECAFFLFLYVDGEILSRALMRM